MSFENPQKSLEKQDSSLEVMKMPEIVVREERGAQLFSLLLKAENPEWGETETPLAKETAEHFRDNPIDPEILKTIKDLHREGADEETLYNLALTYQNQERAEKILEMATKYKPHIKNPQEIYRKFSALLENFNEIFSASPLAEKFATEIEQDKNERLQRLEETGKRIELLIDFFKPDSKTTDVKKISFIPTDPLYKKNFGRNFSAFPGEQIIISHIDNTDNQDHEFLHGIINPIVEKLSKQLTDEQKEKIFNLAKAELKQDYGEEYFSLLCEEFIRTYIEAFKNKSREYSEVFEKNSLRGLIFELYQEYSDRSNKETVNFEQFVLKNFPDRIKNLPQ